MSAETSGQHRRRWIAASATQSAAPLLARWIVVGATSAGVIGAIVGMVVGLRTYPPTAWFAVFELGIPATIAGGLVGFVAALVVMAGRRIMRLIVTAR
jgi:ABC-type uncharacterized transport system permease subunit